MSELTEDEIANFTRLAIADFGRMMESSLFGGATTSAPAPKSLTVDEFYKAFALVEKLRIPDSETPEVFWFQKEDCETRFPKLLARLGSKPMLFDIPGHMYISGVPVRLSNAIPKNELWLMMKDQTIKIINIGEIDND